MRLLVQRVSEARVIVEEKIVGSISTGLLILFGVRKGDALESTHFLAQKAANLRCFAGSEEKMNLSLIDIQGGALIVSQFTLYGNCTHGRRPDFFDAEAPDKAKTAYEVFVKEMRKHVSKVETGTFGAKMQVHLVNEGPVTFLIDSP
jgi:D-aminoacyl-tRNA deacylase